MEVVVVAVVVIVVATLVTLVAFFVVCKKTIFGISGIVVWDPPHYKPPPLKKIEMKKNLLRPLTHG